MNPGDTVVHKHTAPAVDALILEKIVPQLYELIVDLAAGRELPKELRIRVYRALPQRHIDRLEKATAPRP